MILRWLVVAVAVARSLAFQLPAEELLNGLAEKAQAASFQDVKEHISGLEKAITDEERASVEDIKNRKEAYEVQLVVLHQTNDALAANNSVLQETLTSLRTTVSNLRGDAEHLLAEGQKVTSQLLEMQHNLTNAQEIASQALNASKINLDTSELSVLKEMAEEDAALAHKEELKGFLALPKVSMLRVADAGAPEDFLKLMEAQLKDAVSERSASLLKLETAFKGFKQQLQENQTSLLKQQVELKGTIDATKATNERLKFAVAHISHTKLQLEQRISALRIFGREQLGTEEGISANDAFTAKGAFTALRNKLRGFADKGQSLLQIKTSIPESELTDAFKGLTAGVTNLEQSVKAEEVASLEDIKSHKMAYEQQLLEKRSANKALTTKNAELKDHVHLLHDEISALRRNADTLLQDSKNLDEKLEAMQTNITTASAFVQESLELSRSKLQAAPELAVLNDLAEQDRTAEHAQELKNFAHMKVSMLSMAGDVDSATAEETVKHLQQKLNDATTERDASLAKLSQAFEMLSTRMDKSHAQLLHAQADWNAKLSFSAHVKGRLMRAIAHLTATRQNLKERIVAIQSFGRERLGSVEHLSYVSFLQTSKTVC